MVSKIKEMNSLEFRGYVTDDKAEQEAKRFELCMDSAYRAMVKTIEFFNVPELAVTKEEVCTLVNIACKTSELEVDVITTQMFEEDNFQICINHSAFEGMTVPYEILFGQYLSDVPEILPPFIQEFRHLHILRKRAGSSNCIDKWLKYMLVNRACKKECRRCLVLEKVSLDQIDYDMWYGMMLLYVCNIGKRVSPDFVIIDNCRYAQYFGFNLYADVTRSVRTKRNAVRVRLVFDEVFDDEAVRVGIFDNTHDIEFWHNLRGRDSSLGMSFHAVLGILKDCPKLLRFVEQFMTVSSLKENRQGEIILRFEPRDGDEYEPYPDEDHIVDHSKADIEEHKAKMEAERKIARQAQEKFVEESQDRKRKGALEARDLTVPFEDKFTCHNSTRKLKSEDATCDYFLSNDGSKSDWYGYEDTLGGLGECISKDDVVKVGNNCYSRNTLSQMFKAQRHDFPYRKIQIRGEPEVDEAELDALGIDHRL